MTHVSLSKIFKLMYFSQTNVDLVVICMDAEVKYFWVRVQAKQRRGSHIYMYILSILVETKK